MKSMLKSTALYEAFIDGGIGTRETYPWWTTVWGLRSGIWQDKRLAKQARKSLGDMAKTAIEEGKVAPFQNLSRTLDAIIEFERNPADVLRANIYFGVFELNASLASFTQADVRAWLKEVLGIKISADKLASELEQLHLADQISPGKES